MRSHHAFMILSGTSLCVIGGSVAHLRSGSAAGQIFVADRQTISQAPSGDTHFDLVPDSPARVLQNPEVLSGQAREDRSIPKTAGTAQRSKRNVRSLPLATASGRAEDRQTLGTPASHPATEERSTNESVPTPNESAMSEPVFPGQGAEAGETYYYSSPQSALRNAYFVKVDPTSPGNSVVANGQRVSVEAYETVADGSEMELDVDIASVVLPENTSRVNTESGRDKDARLTKPKNGGFTYEDELFRTKWGWAAFNKVQQAARDNPGGAGR